MVEFVGLVKVNVVKGTNLAIRDIVTSDPYVILALGQQVWFLFHKYADVIICWTEMDKSSEAIYGSNLNSS